MRCNAHGIVIGLGAGGYLVVTNLVYRLAFAVGAVWFVVSIAAGVVEEWREARSLPPLDPSNLVQARRDLAEGRIEEGISQYRTMVALSPRAAGPRLQLGRVLAQRGDRDGAIEAFEGELVVNPRSLPANQALAILYLRAGQRERALEHARAALQSGGTFKPEVMRALGMNRDAP